jgi:hypothetical protein
LLKKLLKEVRCDGFNVFNAGVNYVTPKRRRLMPDDVPVGVTIKAGDLVIGDQFCDFLRSLKSDFAV